MGTPERTVTPEELDRLTQHLGRFAMGMLVTFGEFEAEMSDEAAAHFRRHIDVWVAVAGEYVDFDELMNKEQENA